MKRKLVTPRTVRSEVWKHFGFEVDENGVIKDKKNVWCRVCDARVTYSGNTSNLASHIGKCLKSLAVVGLPSVVKRLRKTKSTTPCAKKEHDGVFALVKFITKDMCSIDFVHGVGFHDLIKDLCPNYEMPKRDDIIGCIESMIVEKKKVIMQELNSVKYVSVTVDLWTSVTTNTYIEVTCHFIDSNWILQTRPLEIKQLEQPYTSTDISIILKNCEEKWCLQGKVVAYITANLADIIETMSVSHVNCTAHILQRIVADAIKVQDVAELVDKARKIIYQFKQIEDIEINLENSQKQQRLYKPDLILDVGDQWKSTYDMLLNLKKQWKDISSVLVDKELQLSDDELANLDKLCILLEPLIEVATYLGGGKFASAAVVCPIYQSLLKSVALKVDDAACIKNFKIAMMDSLNKMVQSFDPLLVHAAALHPQFKFLRFIPKEEHEDVWYEIKAELFTLYVLNVSISGEDNNNDLLVRAEKPSPKKRGLLDDSDDEFEDEEQHCVEKEVIGYGQEKKSDIDANLWWKANCTKYPFLAQLAKRYLSVVATCIPSYQLFGMEESIIMEKRKRLFGSNIEDVIFLHSYFQYTRYN